MPAVPENAARRSQAALMTSSSQAWKQPKSPSAGARSLISHLQPGQKIVPARLSMTHLDGTGDGNLVVNTTAFPTRSPANPGFVHLNMVLGLSTDPVLVGPHHARAELVENLKGRLVARKTKLPLKTARRTCRASDWRPDKRPRTRRSAECGYAPSLFPPSARCSGGTCGSAGRQGGFQSGTALPPCRSAGRQSRPPQRAFSR